MNYFRNFSPAAIQTETQMTAKKNFQVKIFLKDFFFIPIRDSLKKSKQYN